MNNQIILIMGRTGSGKDTFAKELMDRYSLKQLISYTTRPRRTKDENTHIFITKEEAKKITNRVAQTILNNHEYFTTKDQVEASDIYIIDPKGLEELAKNSPSTNLHIIYVSAPYSIRKERGIARADDKEKEIEIFEGRNSDEDEMFTSFEENIKVLSHIYPQVKTIYMYDNSKSDIEEVKKMVEEFYSSITKSLTTK